MNTKIEFTGGVFVSSKDELGYQEVLNDFKSAKTIKVVTYNITKNIKDDKLFDLLKTLTHDVDIELITNIPSRFEWYSSSNTGEYLRKTASTNINTYLKKLNPNDFNSNIIPFFNFNNHAKIIGTENIVYIGSANFSNESSRNYETGILIKDKQFIRKLFELFFNTLKENSIPYFNDDYNQLRLFIVSILTRIHNHVERFMESLFYTNRNGDMTFISQESAFSYDDQLELIHDLHELDGISGLIENIEVEDEAVNELLGSIFELCNEIDAEEIINLVGIDTTFHRYISFDFEDTFWDCFQEYNSLADEEMLEHYTEIATSEANEVFEDLCYEVETDIYEIKLLMLKTLEILKEILIYIQEISSYVINEEIDNTLN